MAKLNLNVHQLVDFVLRTGDIDSRIFNRSSMSEGTLLHALYQSKQNDNYLSEIPLEATIFHDDIEVHIEGRADGIIKKSKKKYADVYYLLNDVPFLSMSSPIDGGDIDG